MVEMLSRRLQKQLLSSRGSGGSALCGAIREAILQLCRDNALYGGQIEVDGIICITGPQDGEQLVVKVHELLDDSDAKSQKPGHGDDDDGGGGGGGDGDDDRDEGRRDAGPDSGNSSRRTPEQLNRTSKGQRRRHVADQGGGEGGRGQAGGGINECPSAGDEGSGDNGDGKEAPVYKEKERGKQSESPHQSKDTANNGDEEWTDANDKDRRSEFGQTNGNGQEEESHAVFDDECCNNEQEGTNVTSSRRERTVGGGSSGSGGGDGGNEEMAAGHGEYGDMGEALDLRLDSPAGRMIKQEPMDYEESHRYHHKHSYSQHHRLYGGSSSSSSSSGSIYPLAPCHDVGRSNSSGGGGGGDGSNSTTVDDRHLAAAEGGSSSSTRASSPPPPHTSLFVPFLGPPHHAHPSLPHPPPPPPHATDLAEAGSFPAPGPPPYMDSSRLRHLLAKMPYARPHHPGVPFFHRRPLFPAMATIHSGAPECKACGFTFAQVELLKEHNEAVHAVFTCSVCYRTFTSRSNLDRHSRLHTGHKPYICVKCGKAFSRKDHLTNHSAKHAFKCGKCLKRFVERDALQGHYDQDHQVALTNICEHCNKGFSDPAVFTEHLKSHPEYLGGAKIHPKHKPFACTECNYVCADKLQLLKHSQLHGDSGQNLVYNCLACGESFGDPLLYSQHFESHQDQQDIFECCICRKMCRSWRELKQHEQTHLHHSSRAPTLSCPVCYIIFDKEDVLAEHVQTAHDPVSLAMFPCNVCNEAFSSMDELQQHEQEEKHYVKKAFMSPHPHLSLSSSPTPPSLPLSVPLPPAYPSVDSPLADIASPSRAPTAATKRSFLSSAGDSDTADSDAELDVIAVDDSTSPPPRLPPSSSTSPPAPVPPKSSTPVGSDDGAEKKGHYVKDFVITDNPTPIIEVSVSDAEADANTENSTNNETPRSDASPPPLPPPQCGSPQSSCPSPANSICSFAASISSVVAAAAGATSPVAPPPPPPPPSAAVFPERSPHHPPLALSPPTLAMHGPLLTTPSPQPDPTLDPAPLWLPPQFHNHNSTAYAFPAPVAEYPCPMCDVKLLSFHDFETHCFSDHFRYPCMYCAKTFAQKANRDRHVCIHTGEKPYPCPECDQRFARGDKLKIHRMKWHNVQFPSTYNRPKDGALSGSEGGRRKDGGPGGDWSTGGGTKDGSNAGRWSDTDSQDRIQSEGHGNSYGIKVEGQTHTSPADLGSE